MTTEPLGTTIEEPLARLVAFEPTTLPVLSVYLNTPPDQHGYTPASAGVGLPVQPRADSVVRAMEELAFMKRAIELANR